MDTQVDTPPGSINLPTAPLPSPVDAAILGLHVAHNGRLAGQEHPAAQLLQLVLDNIPQAVFWKDRNSVYIWCNRNFAIDAGVCMPENIVGKTDYDLAWTREQADWFRLVDQRVMATDTPEYQFNEPQTQADGKLAWLVTNKMPLHDAQGNVVGVLGTYEDITERRQAEEALRQSQQMLRLVLDNIPQAVFWKDCNSVYIGCNSNFAIDAGINTPEQINGKTDYDLAWTPEQAYSFITDDRRVIDNDTPVYHIIEQQSQADGKLAWLDTNKVPLHNAQGVVVGILGTYEDITERKKAEEALRYAHDELERRVHERTAAEREQRALAEALRDTAALLNSTLNLDEVLDRILLVIWRVVPHDTANIILLEGNLARVVRRRDQIGRFSAGEDLGAAFPIDEIPNLRQMILSQQPVIVRDTLTAPNWSNRSSSSWVRSYLGAPIRAEGTAIGFINLNSATPGFFGPLQAERLRAFADQASIAIQNARLYQQAQELAALEERQRLARELHDAVSQTLWTASLISDVLPTLWNEDQQEGQRSLEKLQRLTRGALAEMRTLLLELRPAALVEARLSDLLQQLAQAVMSRKKVDIDVIIDGECVLPADVQLSLYRLAQEALNNTAKHSRATQVTVRLAADKTSPGNGERLTLTIQDNGRGFDAGLVPPDRLGLEIMRERAQAIKADLQISSQPGTGTQVKIIWPGVSSVNYE